MLCSHPNKRSKLSFSLSLTSLTCTITNCCPAQSSTFRLAYYEHFRHYQANFSESSTSKVPLSTDSKQMSNFAQLKKGITVKANMASSDSIKPQQIFKPLSRSGKISRRYVHSWNVQDEQGTISSVDFQHDVSSFEVIPSEYPHILMADAILTNEILLEDQSSVIHKANLRELASWSDRKVNDAVTNSGKPFMTVRWVVTEKKYQWSTYSEGQTGGSWLSRNPELQKRLPNMY